MSRRERLEVRLERRREWADSRKGKASNLLAQNERYHGDVPFNTQPGHIPERARVIARHDHAMEHYSMAQHHAGKAEGLEAQLERTIFSDDDNAITAIEARIAEHKGKRERIKLVNKLYKKGDAEGLTALGIDLNTLKAELIAKGPYWGDQPYMPYELTNLGARIQADKKRIAEITRQAAQTAQAFASGGMLITGQDYVKIIFAEKPAREILTALKTAGFQWGSGAWHGSRAKIPACVMGE